MATPTVDLVVRNPLTYRRTFSNPKVAVLSIFSHKRVVASSLNQSLIVSYFGYSPLGV